MQAHIYVITLTTDYHSAPEHIVGCGDSLRDAKARALVRMKKLATPDIISLRGDPVLKITKVHRRLQEVSYLGFYTKNYEANISWNPETGDSEAVVEE